MFAFLLFYHHKGSLIDISQVGERYLWMHEKTFWRNAKVESFQREINEFSIDFFSQFNTQKCV